MPIKDRDVPKQEDVERMNQIEREVMRFIGRFQENTEAAIVAGALLRICKHLYDRYPDGPRADFVEGAVAFLLQARPGEGARPLSRVERLSLLASDLYKGIEKTRKPS